MNYQVQYTTVTKLKDLIVEKLEDESILKVEKAEESDSVTDWKAWL